MNHFFLKEGDGLFHFTNSRFEQVEVNKQEIHDGATPSPNAVMCRVLNRLYYTFQNEKYGNQSEKMLDHMARFLLTYPSSFGLWCIELQNRSVPSKEIMITGKEAKNYFLTLHTKRYLPGVICITTHKEDNIASLKGKYQDGETLIYICKDFNCLTPLRDINKAFTEI